MQCKDVRDLFSPYLDGFLESEEQRKVARHLESCATCQAQYTDLRHTVELLRDMPEVTPPAGFRKQLREQLEALEQPVPVNTEADKLRGRVVRRNWMSALAAAAVLVVALGISGLWHGSLTHWAGSGENLIVRLFTGPGQSDKLALEEQVQAGKRGDLEYLLDQPLPNDSAPITKENSESMKFDIATVPDGRGGGDLQDEHSPGLFSDDQTMTGLSSADNDGEPLMGVARIPHKVGSNDNQLAREAHLTLIVSEPVRVEARIADLSQQHNAHIISSSHGDTVILELKVALDGFEPFWDELHSYGKVLESSINDHDLSRDIESAEANVQKLLSQQEEIKQPSESNQIKNDIMEQQRLLQELQEQSGTAVIILELNKEK